MTRGRHASVSAPHGAGRELLEWVVCIAVAVVAALIINKFVVCFIRVEGTSMVPTLQNGERLLVTPSTYAFREPRRGEIIITHYPGRSDRYVKRVIGLPGETIEVREGHVYIDGQQLQEPYADVLMNYDMAAEVIPEGSYFVMGDNRNHSGDSHSSGIGPISRDLILGHAHAVVWPLTNLHRLSQPDVLEAGRTQSGLSQVHERSLASAAHWSAPAELASP